MSKRRDGREAQLPLMPWKGGLKHDWEAGGMHFGGGESCEWTCKNCGKEYMFVFWEVDSREEADDQTRRFEKFRRAIPEYGCLGKRGVPSDEATQTQVERWD